MFIFIFAACISYAQTILDFLFFVSPLGTGKLCLVACTDRNNACTTTITHYKQMISDR